MTRRERADKRVEDLKKALEDARRDKALEEAKERAKDRKANDKRRYRHGAALDEAGLFVLDDSTLGQLIFLLASLATLPDPVGTLDGLLNDVASTGLGGASLVTEDGVYLS